MSWWRSAGGAAVADEPSSAEAGPGDAGFEPQGDTTTPQGYTTTPPPDAPRRARRSGRPWKRVVGGAVAVALVAAAVGTWLVTRSSDEATAATTRLVTASTSTLRETVSASGVIQPARRGDLSFTVSGTVDSVKVEVGDTVKVGQALATVDDDDLQIAVDLAKDAKDAAADSLDSLEDAGASDTQVAAADAQLVQAKSELAGAEENLDAATLTSTVAGTVAAVDIAVGDRVSGGSGGSGGTGGTGGSSSDSSAQVTVISTDSWVIDASVGSADLASVKKGLQAEITPTGSTEKVYGTVASKGIVAETSSSGSSSGSATFPVTIKVTGSPEGLYAGGSATVVIIVKQLTDVLTVPTVALATENGKTVVHQMEDGKQVSTSVTVGEAYGATTQITDGLSEGDQVVVTFTRPGSIGGTQNQNQQNNRQQGEQQQGGFGGPPDQSGGGFPGGAPVQGGNQ